MRRAVFFDRDGVLNATRQGSDGVPRPPADAAHLSLEDGAVEACALLRAQGFLLIGVTNQPDVVRGATTRDAVEAINARLSAELRLDDIAVCFHDDADNCACRKPAPGLLRDAARRWGVELDASYMVGDRRSDVEAGQRAGCRTILIEREYSGVAEVPADHTTDGVLAAAAWILQDLPSSKEIA